MRFSPIDRGRRRRIPATAALLTFALLALTSPSPAQDNRAFAKVKTLAGEWAGTEEDGTPARIHYEVTSGGEALKEVLYMGKAPPMVSIYYPDRDQLMMTHYCLTRTQPRMRTTTYPADLSELALVYVDATNVIQSTGGVMNGLTLRFLTEDRFEQLWNADATDERPVRIRYHRIAEAAEAPAAMATEPETPPLAVSGAPPASLAERALARIASLSGDWRGKEESEGWAVTLRIEAISDGSAVLETMGSSDSGMMTVYHLDGDQLLLTHYCSSRTQPRMRTAAIPDTLDRFSFDYVDATNVLDATESYMHSLVLEIEGENRFRQVWNQDSPDRKPIRIRYERVTPTSPPSKATDGQ